MSPAQMAYQERRRQAIRDRLEDIEFMVQTGEIFSRCARRLGMTGDALESLLRRAKRIDLIDGLGGTEI